MKPAHRKYVKEGGGKHRGGRVETTVYKPKKQKPMRNTKIIVADQVGAKGPGVF